MHCGYLMEKRMQDGDMDGKGGLFSVATALPLRLEQEQPLLSWEKTDGALCLVLVVQKGTCSSCTFECCSASDLQVRKSLALI